MSFFVEPEFLFITNRFILSSIFLAEGFSSTVLGGAIIRAKFVFLIPRKLFPSTSNPPLEGKSFSVRRTAVSRHLRWV